MSDPLKASSIPAEEQLTYQAKLHISFGAYQWVSIKLFRLPGHPIDDQAALRLLLRHVRYRDSYAGTGDKDMVTLHGPYRLDAISIDSFTPADPASAEATLGAWAEEYWALDEAARDWLERELYPRVRNATSCYRLADLGEDAQHDWGWVLGKTGFHELVVVDRVAGSLALVVASDD